MSILYPDAIFDKIYDIDENFIKSNNIKGFILDVDNTLTTHNNPNIDKRVTVWINTCIKNGIKLIILSNNTEKRIAPFAKSLNLDFVSDALKPKKTGYNKAISKLCLQKENIATIGDQIFTDIIGGNRCGIMTILVRPFDENENIFIKFKRQIEKIIILEYKRKKDMKEF